MSRLKGRRCISRNQVEEPRGRPPLYPIALPEKKTRQFMSECDLENFKLSVNHDHVNDFDFRIHHRARLTIPCVSLRHA